LPLQSLEWVFGLVILGCYITQTRSVDEEKPADEITAYYGGIWSK